MKKALTAALCFSAAAAWSQSFWTTNLTLNAVVPDNNFNGYAVAIPMSGWGAGITVSDVTVTLDVTGGFNGDLYAYLAGPTGGFAVLLNRVGMSSGNGFGYSDAGFNITLADGAANGNIHAYQTVPGYGTLINNGSIFAPDGRNIDPRSASGTFDLAATSATLSSFIGTDPNGTWTFFIADLSPGGQSTLVSFGLTVGTVPEPQTAALLGLAGLLGALRLRNRMR